MPNNFFIALLHYPVYNKNKEITATAIFNYDIHDISRVSKTYGINKFFIVQPIEKQLEFGKKILYHWTEDWGSIYNPKRKEALSNVFIKKSLDEVILEIEAEFSVKPVVIVTDAKKFDNTISYKKLRGLVKRKPKVPFLLIFGTGWGLTEEFIKGCDLVLEPVYGEGSYNHLSVRSAAAIILDRLFGR